MQSLVGVGPEHDMEDPEPEPEPELDEYFSGKVVAAHWIDGDSGFVVDRVRLESDLGNNLGWMDTNFGRHCLKCLNKWLDTEPRFLASDLGEMFLLQVQWEAEIP